MTNRIPMAMVMAAALCTGVELRADPEANDGETAEWGPTFSVGADVANAYVFRGQTYNNGTVIQPWITVGLEPLELNVWANYDLGDYHGQVKKNEISEIDYTVSYTATLGPVDATLGYVFWTYPNAPIQDDQLATLDLSHTVGDALTLGVGAEYNTVGPYRDTIYVKPYASLARTLPGEVELTLCAKVGYVDYHDAELGSGWLHYDLGATVGYKIWTAGVTYTGRIDDEVLPSGDFGYDVQWLTTLGLAYDF